MAKHMYIRTISQHASCAFAKKRFDMGDVTASSNVCNEVRGKRADGRGKGADGARKEQILRTHKRRYTRWYIAKCR